MKNKILTILLLSTVIIFDLTGCSNNKYEEDTSYDTDLYGVYAKSMETIDASYSLDETYTFNEDNTYSYTRKEIIDGRTNQDVNETGKILSIKEISDNITEITTDRLCNYEPEKMLKYKNMLGYFDKVQVPKGKTFELYLDNCWFDKDGQYHTCTEVDVCDCKKVLPCYIRKNNIIYFQSSDEEHKDCYTISSYIVDDGLFYPNLKKEEK